MSAPYLTAASDRAVVLENGRSQRYVLVQLKLPARQDRVRLPLRLGLALDRSGSMRGRKIQVARAAVVAAIERLEPIDSFAIIAYDSESEVLVPLSSAGPESKRRAAQAVEALSARRETDLQGGWASAAAQVDAARTGPAVARVILITDGLTNRGFTDHDVIAHTVGVARARRVITSTIGVGSDFDERLLSRMADVGGGHYYYVQSERQLSDTLGGEVGEALSVVALDARLQVESARDVSVESINGFPVTSQRTLCGVRCEVALGDLVTGQQLSLVLRVTVSPSPVDAYCAITLRLLDAQGAMSLPAASVRWRYAAEGENNAQVRNPDVTREAARLFAAQARMRAAELNRRQRYSDAQQLLLLVARGNRHVAGDDPEQCALAAELEREAQQVNLPLDEKEAKTLHSRGYTTMRGLDELSRAIRALAAEESDSCAATVVRSNPG